MMEEQIKVLLVDDEDNFRQFTTSLLVRRGFEVTDTPSGKQALKLLKKNYYDVVLLDLVMPDMGGLEVLSKIKKLDPALEVVVFTGQATIDSALEAMKNGAYDYLRKPVKIEELEIILKKGYEKRVIGRENTILRDELSRYSGYCGVIGQSDHANSIRSFILMAAKSNSPVLILGESGTGKELVARGIYQRSNLSGEWVAINSGSLPSELLASELFGHKKGAFTGASEDKRGLVELADGGVLFIDEIGEMSPQNQVSLLRFLEDGVFRPLGSNREVKVKARIITATNRSLDEEVDCGKFRQDLYYRLNVLSIELPPLRERKEDIPELADFFLAELNKEHNTQKTLARGVLDEQHDWPGNVRELQNIISRGYAVSRADQVTPFDLSAQNKRVPKITPTEPKVLQTIEENEQCHLKRVLAHTGWNKAEAIRILGITYPRLQRLIGKYNINKVQ